MPAVAPATPHPPPYTLVLPLALLAALRALGAIAPGMYLWGLNLQRFLPPTLGWALWGLLAVGLIPRVAEPLAAFGSAAGEKATRRPVLGALVAAGLAALIVLLLPDRAWFTGDYMLRQRAIEAGWFQDVLPQSLPLDSFLHYHLPRALEQQWGLNPPLYARALGIIEAGLLAALAMAFTRSVGAGRAGPWLAAIVIFAGSLAVFTGFPKSTADLCVIALAIA